MYNNKEYKKKVHVVISNIIYVAPFTYFIYWIIDAVFQVPVAVLGQLQL